MRSKLLLVTGLAFAVTSTARAQVSVTPFVGVVTPLHSQIIDTSGGGGSYFRMRSHTVYGLQLGKQFSPTLGVQVQGGAGNGEMEVVSGGTILRIQSALWFADVRAKLRLLGDADNKLVAIAGAGWSQYSLGLFEAAHELDDSTKFEGKFTGIIGLGAKARLGGRLSLAADLTDRIHGQGIEAPGLDDAIEKTQHDIMFQAGLSIPLGR